MLNRFSLQSSSFFCLRSFLGIATATLSLALFAPLLTGCSSSVDDPSTYEGLFSTGFEVVSFTECGASENWWLVTEIGSEAAAESLFTQYHQLTTEAYQPVFVRLKGTPTEKGEYGHVGAYSREFFLSEVIEVRAPASGECVPD